MENKIEKGVFGENLAITFLKNKNYQIIATHFKFGRKEIDIIAIENNCLIFIEVKFRKNTTFGFPEESVNLKKQKNIKEVAEHYIFLNNWIGNIRFDIIAILQQKNKIEYFHIEDAFY
ncbi:MAG: YraN family protein [Bacteroidetes bacterium]|nr:MAG: YraN family protein [Bacteroidota bacterium]TAG88147.1 MAG: YraN family protein [Bacteroidota bacterium]